MDENNISVDENIISDVEKINFSIGSSSSDYAKEFQTQGFNQKLFDRIIDADDSVAEKINELKKIVNGYVESLNNITEAEDILGTEESEESTNTTVEEGVTPTDEKVEEETPADEEAKEETPADEKGKEETPADEQGKEETPADEQGKEETTGGKGSSGGSRKPPREEKIEDNPMYHYFKENGVGNDQDYKALVKNIYSLSSNSGDSLFNVLMNVYSGNDLYGMSSGQIQSIKYYIEYYLRDKNIDFNTLMNNSYYMNDLQNNFINIYKGIL